MLSFPGESLWLGHAGDLRHLRQLHDVGIRAIVDLAADEPFPSPSRDLIYCRFPIVDGPGNPPELLRLALTTIAALLQTQTPTLVACSAGLSRTPALCAAALALVHRTPPEPWLTRLAELRTWMIAPGLWRDVACVLGGE